MECSVKNMIRRRWLFFCSKLRVSDCAGGGQCCWPWRLFGCLQRLHLMRQCKFFRKNCMPSPTHQHCPAQWIRCSGRMLGRVFQTAFCRARQPRYGAVDETEAVHKHGGAFSAWNCSRTSFRRRTSLYEFKLYRRRGLWNGLVRRALSILGVSFFQQVQMRLAPPNAVRFCSFQSNNFILALFLFNAQLRVG